MDDGMHYGSETAGFACHRGGQFGVFAGDLGVFGFDLGIEHLRYTQGAATQGFQ